MATVASTDLYFAAAASEEVDTGLNDARLVESETIQLFPDEASQANLFNDQTIFSTLAAVRPVTTCGRNGLPPCTPPQNPIKVPPNCSDPRNRDCRK
ncbi:hypothetical protein V6N11_024787 [Hibiscus sabdariffa]|uniref:Uncharacterized protein n=1 Tax=Hibiscus sabdariffa TaxID=183260 RepID=A0ABR2QN48_9ROSI